MSGKKQPHDKSTVTQRTTEAITKFLDGAFETVANSRRTYFEANPDARPGKRDIDRLIKSAANTNAVIAGAANLIPGPWGALAVVPEIILVVKNQIQLIYDLGVAHGKETSMDPRLLLGVFATVSGGGAISVASVRGGQLIVKRASLRVVQQLVKWLGGKITQRALRAFFAKWVPIVGAGVMAVWARQSTIALGEKASELLSKDIRFEDD